MTMPCRKLSLPRMNLQGRLPALGWNSWNAFGCNINAADIITAANETVNLGLKDAGYEYINSKDIFPRSPANAGTDKSQSTTVGLYNPAGTMSPARWFPIP